MATNQQERRSLAETEMRAAAEHPQAIATIAVIGLALGSAALVKILYDHMKEKVQPLSGKDLEKYRDLVTVYQEHYPRKPNIPAEDPNIPKSWVLTNQKPSFRLDFEATGLRLHADANQLRQHNSRDHEARAIMLEHISKLFIALHERWSIENYFRHYVRADGIEIMFYQEFTDWLLDAAPNLHALDDKKLAEYKRRLDYCESIQQRVLTAERSDGARINPNSTLKRLIIHLRNYYEKLVELKEAQSLNRLLEELRSSLLGLNKRFIEASYLQIYGVSTTTFVLDDFLSPGKMNKRELKARKTHMGTCLYKTLNVAGVSYLLSEPSTLSILSIRDHLKGVHPDDEGFNGSPPSADKMRWESSWGLHDFIRSSFFTKIGDEEEKKYLRDFIELNRTILELYYITQTLLHTSKVDEHFEDSWLYGNPAAKANLRLLLNCSISLFVRKAVDDFKLFWRAFYDNKFIPYANGKNLNLTNKKYLPLVYINDTLSREMNDFVNSIDTQVDLIKKRMSVFQNRHQELEKSKIIFFESVLAHCEYHGQTDNADYRIAKAELERLRQHQNALPEQQQNGCVRLRPQDEGEHPIYTMTSIIPKADKLAQALNCLNSPSSCSNLVKYKRLPELSESCFYSDLQYRAFHTIIKGYYKIMHNQFQLSFWRSSLTYEKKQFALFQRKYARLYDAFQVLYFKEGSFIDMSAPALASFKQENAIAIGIFDQELLKFLSEFEHLELLFRSDSHVTHAEIVGHHQSVLTITTQKNGDYLIERNHRYDDMQSQTTMNFS